MTREEAITVLKAFMDNPLFSEVHKAAFNIAIHDIKQRHDWDINNLILINKDNYEPIEQEPILDKLRAEIAEYGSIWVEYTITDNSVSGIENLIEDVLEQAKDQVLQIIDKYQTQETHEKCTENARKTHGIFTTGV